VLQWPDCNPELWKYEHKSIVDYLLERMSYSLVNALRNCYCGIWPYLLLKFWIGSPVCICVFVIYFTLFLQVNKCVLYQGHWSRITWAFGDWDCPFYLDCLRRLPSCTCGTDDALADAASEVLWAFDSGRFTLRLEVSSIIHIITRASYDTSSDA
jgi:hypothetical protein